MAEGATLDRLALRKQTLLLESRLNRIEMARETEILRDHLRWLEDPIGSARENSGLLLVLAPVAGVLAGRLLRHASPGASKLSLLTDCLRHGWPLWKRFAAGFFGRNDSDER